MINVHRIVVRANARRGAAMMMVLVLLALLLVLAVSFTFLMTQQEGTSVASLGGESTRIGARTGADHAYARLNARNRLNEFAAWWATRPSDLALQDMPWRTDPFVDGFDESIVDLLYDFEGADGLPPLFAGLRGDDGQPFRVEDARRLVLGLTIQDESGKVNLNFANPMLIANLLGSATTIKKVEPSGDVYEIVTLTDSSFLTPYDEDKNPNDNRGGPGLVVIDGALFSYQYRLGNSLYKVIPNAPCNGPTTARGENALFRYWNPDRDMARGSFVCTPTAYKIAYRRYLEAGPGGPPLYGSLGEVRQIADMPRWIDHAPVLGPYVMGEKLPGWPEGLDPVMYQRLERLATVMAPTERFDGGWFYPHIVRAGDMVQNQETSLWTFGFTMEDRQAFQASFHVPQDPRSPIPTLPQPNYQFAGIGSGNLVRFRQAGGQAFYGVLVGGNAAVVAGEHVINLGEPWIMECAERATININTAPPEVIEAVFHGIGPRGEDPEDGPITRDAARRLAYEIIARIRDPQEGPFRTLDELELFLTALSQRDATLLTQDQRNMFVQAQRYPYARGVQATAQFSFDSLDTYMVDSYATRYQPTGGVVARRAFREWASVGSDRSQRYIWRDYVRWLAEMRVPQGNVFRLYGAGVDPEEDNQREVGVHELPFVHYQDIERYMRQRETPAWSTGQTRDMFAMGVDNPPRMEKFYANVVQGSSGGPAFPMGDLQGGMFSLWYRPQWTNHNQNHYIFDAAERPYSNRMSLLWWGQRQRGHRLAQHNSGLVLRLKDRSLEEGFSELRYEMEPAAFRTGDWYHLASNWKGTELSHLNLMVDGDCAAGPHGQPVRPVINHTFLQPNGAWVCRTSTLERDLEDTTLGQKVSTEIVVHRDDIDAFPPYGVVVIGDEAIEYDGNNGIALLNIYRGPPLPGLPNSARGARGTTARFHPRGSRVTVYGYTAPVHEWIPTGNANLNNPMVPRFPFLPATGGNLRSAMNATGIFRVSKAGTINPLYYRSTELGPDAGFPGGVGQPGETGDYEHLPLADYTGLQERGIVAVYGFAWRGYLPPGTQGIPAAGVSYPDFGSNGPPAARLIYPGLGMEFEYVAYDRIDPQGLHVIARYDQTFTEKQPDQYWHFMGTYSNLIVPMDPTGQIHAAEVVSFFSAGSAVVPVSIDIDNAAGYHYEPANGNIPPRGSAVQVGGEWFFYNRVWDHAARPGTDPLTLLFCTNGGSIRAYVDFNAFNDLKQPTPWNTFRGWAATGFGVHATGMPVTPVFATTIRTGPGDVVTTINGKNYDKVLNRIVRQPRGTDISPYIQPYLSNLPPLLNVLRGQDHLWGTLDDLCLCALQAHCPVNYLPNTTWRPQNPAAMDPWQAGNLCKFPTGELPVEMPINWTFAAPDPRAPEGQTGTADFDSFELRSFGVGNFRLAAPMTDSFPSEGGDIRVNALGSQFPPLGVIKIDDELIAYRALDATAGRLLDITRGVLGTVAQAHAQGSPIMNMASMRVAMPNGGASTQTNMLAARAAEEPMRPYGFVRIAEGNLPIEIAGYQKNIGSAQAPVLVAGMYNDPADSQALFRGLYGTQARAYGPRALFFDQPVRFPDYFPGYHLEGRSVYGPWHQRQTQGIPGARSPEIAHVQGSATFRNSVFEDFKWRVAWLPHAEQARYANALGARLVIRFRGRGAFERLPDWGEVPTNKPGGLYSYEFQFGGPDTEQLQLSAQEQTQGFDLPETPGGVRADGIEWRVYFYFKENAFRDDLYKATLQFQGASATVRQLTKVYRHEEKR